MFNRRVNPYIIAIGIAVCVCLFYLGLKAYQTHVELEAFIEEAVAFSQSLDVDDNIKGASPVARPLDPAISKTRRGSATALYKNRINALPAPKQVVKVEVLPPDRGAVLLRTTPAPPIEAKTYTLEDMVRQSIQLPDGKIVEILSIPGLEVQEGDSLTIEYLEARMPIRTTHTQIDGVRYDIPIGADTAHFKQKAHWASALDVSVAEVEGMIANRELIVKPNGAPMTLEEAKINFNVLRNIPKFASHIPDLMASHPELSEASSHLDNAPIPSQQRVETTVPESASFDAPSNSVDKAHAANGAGVYQEEGPVHAPTTTESAETQFSEQLSPERFDKAQLLIDQFGTEEGLRRLKEADPDAAQQFEREHLRSEKLRPSESSRDAPDGAESER